MSLHPALPYLRSSEKGKVVSAAEAERLIRDGDTVATGGFVGIGFATQEGSGYNLFDHLSNSSPRVSQVLRQVALHPTGRSM
jgi:acyl CoA:acetate/3-ketoacid CoA transferase